MTILLVFLALVAMAEIELSELSGELSPADTLILPGITVTADRFDIRASYFPVRSISIHTDSIHAFAAQTAGDMLSRLTIANVRSYGPGLAQTVSLHGFSGSQMTVLWDDIPLNNPMLGLTDLSLYPAVMIDQMDVNAHQGSAEYGAHAIGGVIQLRQHRSQNPMQTIIIQGNSIASRSIQGRVMQPLGKWYLDVGGVYQLSPNRFTYQDITRNPVEERKRENAQKELASIFAQVSYTGTQLQHTFRLWATDVHSGIPGSIVGPSPSASQHDGMLRLSNRTNMIISQRSVITTALSFSHHKLDFRDPDTNINSLSTSRTSSGRMALRVTPSVNQQLRLQGGYSISNIEFTEYDAPQRNHGFFQLNAYSNVFDWHIHPSVRYDMFNQFGNALTASLGIVREYDLLDSRVFANASRNFAPPTFNDLYWPGSGNTALVPETSIKLDFGFETTVAEAKIHVQFFDNHIENGIQWLPSSVDGRFRPRNIRAVRSSGVSAGLNRRFRTGGFTHFASGEFTILDARYTRQRFTGDDAKGNQLVYQPRYRSMLSLTSDMHVASISFSYNFTGSRSITEDNALQLPSNHIVNAGLHKDVVLGNQKLTIAALIENVLDARYELIRFYPMPGRHIHLSLKITR
ncbi:MAG: TonB-dependent receptor [Bacteroidetes bacterium]|nr:TonB-dependent receptor [Bacteroidota bacterium]MCH8522932.1 TonB-dependent receptor [Balneolales bacterium]